MKNQKKQTPNQNPKKQMDKSETEKKIEKIKNLYDFFPNYIDKSTKNLLLKYNL